jgi:predicted nucleotide-binding protein
MRGSAHPDDRGATHAVEVTKKYGGVVFPSQVIRRGFDLLKSMSPKAKSRSHQTFSRGSETWRPDELEEWYAELPNLAANAFRTATLYVGEWDRYVLDYTHFSEYETTVQVKAPTQAEVQRVLNVFNEAYEDSRIPEPEPKAIPEPEPISPVVFLGHGHSGDWRKIKDHLQDKHGHMVEAYEVGSRAGHTVRDALGSMMRASSIAFLIMTAEDELADGTMRARQNVVHEAGLFQGRLGFPKAIAVVEEGVEVFSNLDGVDQIRYPKGHVEASFGEILAVVRREFPEHK